MTPPNLTATVSYDTPKSNNSYCNNDIPKSYQRCRDPVSVLSWPRHQSIQIKRAEISSTTNRPLQSWRPVQKKKSFRNKSEPSLCFLKRNNIHVHLFIKGSCLYKNKSKSKYIRSVLVCSSFSTWCRWQKAGPDSRAVQRRSYLYTYCQRLPATLP